MKRLILFLALFLEVIPLAWGGAFKIEVLRLSPRVAVFYGDPWDNAIVAIATQKGIVVVDAPFSKTISEGFREAIQAEFKRTDFACLINTHEHHCHVNGNSAFADIPIIAHESLRRQMLKSQRDTKWAVELRDIGNREVADVRELILKADPKKINNPGFINYETGWNLIQADLRANPVLVPPTITFDKEMTLHLGDVAVKLIYYGHSHGIADTIVSLPEENLILTAGVFYPTHVPALNRVSEESTSAMIDNWFLVMHRLLKGADDATRFLASHGRAVMRKGQYEQFVAYLEGTWNRVQQARSKGKTLEQAKSEILLSDFPEIAKLPNEVLRGTEWENLNIHEHNIEHLWKVLDGTTR